MKGLLVLLFLVLIGANVFNWIQINDLKRQVAAMQLKMDEQQRSANVSDQVVAEATRAIAQAREAIAHTNLDSARAKLESATRTLQDAARTASLKAAPTVRWLQDEASDLRRQVEDRIKNR